MNIRTLLTALAIFTTIIARSQEVEGKNMGKINLSAFTFKGFGLQYERQLSNRVTAAIGYSKIPTSTIAFQSFIKSQIDNPNVNVGAFRLGTSIFTPEVRYYFGKKGAFHGFYLAPYARIGSYDITVPIQYVSSTYAKRDAIFNGKLNTITGGIMMGSSFQLSGKFYLDWWIAGGSVGSAKGNLVAVTALSKDEQKSLQDEINSLNVPLTKIEAQVSDNGATITTTGTMFGVRGLGINFGFRF